MQQHPEGVCYANPSCVLPQTSNIWTIHGLWPSELGTEGPNFCGDSSTVFNISLLEDIIADLESSWPSLEDRYSQTFWSHEWCKHGTCARYDSYLDTEYKFFSSALKLYEKYNFGDILLHYNIKPTNSTGYKSDSFYSAFDNAIHVKPLLECKYLKDQNRQILYQISICINKSLKPTPCDASIYKRTSCWTTEDIYYYSRF